MNSFRNYRLRDLTLPTGPAWMPTDIAEAKGKQGFYTRQSPQILKALRDTANIQSVGTSNRIEGVIVDRDRLRPLILGNARPRDRSEEEVAGSTKFVAADVSPLHLISRRSQSRLTSAATVQGFKSRIGVGQNLTLLAPYHHGFIRRACAEFEQRASQIKSPRGAKTELFEHTVAGIFGNSTIAELEKRCPGVSCELIRHRLKELKLTGFVECIGRGPEAK